MAYHSVVHGAKALLYYGQLHCTRPNSASGLWSEAKDEATQAKEFKQCQELNAWFWEQHRSVFAELKQAAKIFVLPNKTEGAIKVTGGSTIESLAKEHRAQQYLLAVNADKAAVEVELEMPADVKVEEVHVLFENRKIAVRDRNAKDHFAGYGVHVYATSPELPAE